MKDQAEKNLMGKPHGRTRQLGQLWTAACIFAVTAMVCGCTPAPEFRLNAVESRKQEISVLKKDRFQPAQIDQLGDIMIALFGTPDEPRFPYELLEGDEELARELVDLKRLQQAAGPVSSDRLGKQRGLYREHCVQCHGVSGDGLGPTAAVLNPYPRDFRMGKFKFKSTPIGTPPTRDDLRRVIMEGIPGTAMPSFKLLRKPPPEGVDTRQENVKQDDEIEALIDYVIYLSIRGQVERALLDEMTTLQPDEQLLEMELANSQDEEKLGDFEELLGILYDKVAMETGMWLDAEGDLAKEELANLAARPETLQPGSSQRQAMIDRGRELFLGKANCYSCHGNTALGDGQTDKYDAWTDDWMKVVGDSPERLQEFEDLGALPPRKLKPRNLRQGVLRGGRRPIDVFLRVKYGIDGTPMPAAPAGMSDEDLWAIAEYVRQLPEETVAAGVDDKPVNERIVN